MNIVDNTLYKPELSFEFFPARTSKMEQTLWHTLGQLELLDPAYFSVTYGALNSEREHSIKTIDSLMRQSVPVAAHLTASGHSRDCMIRLAQQFKEKGVKRIVAIRGDAPTKAHSICNGITDVCEMILALKAVDDFDISVAAYPEVHPKAISAKDDLLHLKRKLDSGANRAITQYFFDIDVFLRFRDKAYKQRIHQPIVPGILPVPNIDKITSFSERCGAKIPNKFRLLFENTTAGSIEQQKIGIDYAINLCESLKDEGVDAFHFYTLNLPNVSFEVAKHLSSSPVLIQPKMSA